ncbi:unannotated protein [freshwater metagenome]|uniref:Unannotated protein n=1 Tax=freshwater metagenome TaxID=449393 RepID=A0A6J6RSF4_9ZZZZ
MYSKDCVSVLKIGGPDEYIDAFVVTKPAIPLSSFVHLSTSPFAEPSMVEIAHADGIAAARSPSSGNQLFNSAKVSSVKTEFVSFNTEVRVKSPFIGAK